MAHGVAVIDRGARSDRSGRHRLLLWRELAAGSGGLLWVLCNPSTADDAVDDPTVRRCVGFAAGWGFRRVEVANCFTFRATDPRALRAAADPVAPGADTVLRCAAARADAVVVGWGSAGRSGGRDAAVLGLLAAAGVAPTCLGRNRDGTPRHPLYAPRSAARLAYSTVSGGGPDRGRQPPAVAPRR